ncbi:MAG: hypothetical protein RBS38_00050 [Bacteroidales bacterium]|nr:hypothetical protein [Bacteroidales bacterium]
MRYSMLSMLAGAIDNRTIMVSSIIVLSVIIITGYFLLRRRRK